ncbi:MAG: chemotaxis protein CheD [Gammaproteobacteria bacterium]
MRHPSDYIEIFLQPGEHYFGDADTRIRTLLGSCVSLTLWHPRLRIGGMCHYLLPSRMREAGNGKDGDAGGALDGRYGEEATELLLGEIRAANTAPSQYEVKLFGGGEMFPQIPSGKNGTQIPGKNVGAARSLAKRYGFKVVAEDMGGRGYRNIIFDIWSGNVWVRTADRDPRRIVIKPSSSRVKP